MNAFAKRAAALLPAFALTVSYGLTQAAELNAAAVTYKLPDQIQW